MSTHVRGHRIRLAVEPVAAALAAASAGADEKAAIRAGIVRVADAIIAGKVDLAREAMRKLTREAMDLICKREAQERRAGNRPLRADRP